MKTDNGKTDEKKISKTKKEKELLKKFLEEADEIYGKQPNKQDINKNKKIKKKE
ncbi:MAG: hypothetical protein ACTSWY_04915 [Promethearchaeota archaeon]